jgi:hypothetical protein
VRVPCADAPVAPAGGRQAPPLPVHFHAVRHND